MGWWSAHAWATTAGWGGGGHHRPRAADRGVSRQLSNHDELDGRGVSLIAVHSGALGRLLLIAQGRCDPGECRGASWA